MQPVRLGNSGGHEYRNTYRRRDDRNSGEVKDEQMRYQWFDTDPGQCGCQHRSHQYIGRCGGNAMPRMRQMTATIRATRNSCSPATLTTRVESVTPIPVKLSMATRIWAPASSPPMITIPLPASSSPAS